MASASESVSAARESPELVLPPTSLDLASIEGSSVWMINAVNTPATAEVAGGFEAAAIAAGVDATVFDGRGAAATWSAGITQAVAQGADAIVLLSIPPEVVAEPIAAAAEQGITVVDAFAGGPEAELAPGVFAHTTFDPVASGADLADWVLADSGCSAGVLVLGAESLALHTEMMDGATERFDELCAGCPVTQLGIDLGTMATTLQPRVEAALRQQPDIDYIVSSLDAAVTYLQPAVASVGRDVKIVGHDGVETNLEFIRNGSGQSADVALPPLAVLGWMSLDQAMRGMLELEPAADVLPTRIVDETNVGVSGDNLFENYGEYASEWESAWLR